MNNIILFPFILGFTIVIVTITIITIFISHIPDHKELALYRGNDTTALDLIKKFFSEDLFVSRSTMSEDCEFWLIQDEDGSTISWMVTVVPETEILPFEEMSVVFNDGRTICFEGGVLEISYPKY